MSENPYKIIILSSHPIVGELIAYRLRLLDLDPIVVESDEDLEATLSDCLPHLFMIDLDVSVCDGIHVVERLSSDEVTSRVPILCMSAEGDLDRAEKAYRSGAREFLVVPFDPIVLEDKVTKQLAQFDERQKEDDKNRKVAAV